MTTNEHLKMKMALLNISQTELAEQIGISKPTIISRFNDGNWKYFEILELIRILGIKKPHEVFFQ